MIKLSFNRGRQMELARKLRCFSQSELAKKVNGLSQSNLSKFEKGFNTLSIDLQKKIMEELNFPFEFLDKTVKQVDIL